MAEIPLRHRSPVSLRDCNLSKSFEAIGESSPDIRFQRAVTDWVPRLGKGVKVFSTMCGSLGMLAS